MRGNIVIRTGPRAEPISLAEARLQCRIDDDSTEEDSLVTLLIAAARAHVEKVTNRALITQGVRATFPQFPSRPARFDLRAPLRKVVAITYLDTAGDSQTLGTGDYVVDVSELPGIVVPAYSSAWPMTYEHPAAVTVDFTAGYATPFTVAPDTDIVTAVGHPLNNGDIIRLYNSGGALPAGLDADTDYYVIGASGGALQLSAAEGSTAIDITDAGTGLHFLGVVPEVARMAMLLLIDHWFRNRGATGEFQVNEVPFGVDMLLSPLKVYGF